MSAKRITEVWNELHSRGWQPAFIGSFKAQNQRLIEEVLGAACNANIITLDEMEELYKAYWGLGDEERMKLPPNASTLRGSNNQ